MKAGEVKRGYQVKEHGTWSMVDMVITTFVNAVPETEETETKRLVLACGCTIVRDADEEVEAREWNPRLKLAGDS